MKSVQTEVLVIGGGATGSGVAWDAATRGFETILVERKDLAEGTTGRFHGLLHSGGRYAVKDKLAAEECIHENRILRRVASDSIEDTGGYFVTTPWDDPAFGDKFMDGCKACEIPVEEIAPSEAFLAEPRMNRDISRVFAVPDAAIDGWKLVWDCAKATTEHGGQVLTYHRVLEILRSGDVVRGAKVRSELSGEEFEIHADFTINATGAWAGKVADMGGCPGVQVLAGKGIMIAMNHRLVNTVVNRCTMPADGDILVPIRTVSVIGTTDIRIKDPDEPDVTQDEVDRMLDDGEKLVPGFRKARALRVWAGVRPLFKDTRAPETSDTRDVSRSHALLDHKERDGVTGFLTITGGKLTTFRMMAQETVDKMCEQLGTVRECRTSSDPLPSSKTGRFMWVGERLKEREATMHDDQLICECELIQRNSLEGVMKQRSSANLDDIRRALRLGMGPCQGGFCMYRATGLLHDVERMDAPAANRSLRDFLQERWKGVQPILYGDQLRQARLDDWIFQGVLDVEHLPTDRFDDRAIGERGMRDVLVIGIGMSGLTAALRCQEAGLAVTLLAKGVGSTHLAPGTIDVLGYDPELVESPSEALPRLIDRNPEHPYASIGTEAVSRSLEWFAARFDDYRYTGSVNENFLLPTAIGSIKPSALVPETMASGDLRNGGRFLFVGLRQLKDFFPALVAQNVAHAKTPSGADVSARAVQIEPPTGGEADVTSLAFARMFDDPEFVGAVATQISAHVESDEAVGLPAVLGTERPREVWKRLQEALGRPVFEIPGLPPSVPGIRLYEILRAQFEAGGGRVVVGAEAVGADTDGNRVTAVRVAAAARIKPYPARYFVLAAGGFGTGAIEMSSSWRVQENVFGLPVAGVPPDGQERFSPRYLDSHPLGRAGIRVDDSLRALDENGTRVYENLTVVGACLAGSEAWREKSGEGMSLSSGYKAATTIVEGQT